MGQQLYLESRMGQVFDEIVGLLFFLNLLDDSYWTSEIGMCG